VEDNCRTFLEGIDENYIERDDENKTDYKSWCNQNENYLYNIDNGFQIQHDVMNDGYQNQNGGNEYHEDQSQEEKLKAKRSDNSNLSPAKAKFLDKLTKEDIENYKAAFSFYDKNRDGVIDVKDLLHILRNVGENPTEDEIDLLVNEFTLDYGRKKIDFQEFLTKLAERDEKKNSTEDLRTAFQMFDVNKDGGITVRELRELMVKLNDNITDAEVIEMMDAADLNQDGYIDFDEFVAMMKDG